MAESKQEADGWTVFVSKNLSQIMNKAAEAFNSATEPAEKRRALRRYLEWLHDTLGHLNAATLGHAVAGAPEYMNLGPIRELEVLLIELENGECPDILIPARRKIAGRAATERRKQMWWATASYLVTDLMDRFGYSEDEAAKAVVAQLKARDLPLPGRNRANSPVWKQLQSWRDDLLRGKKGKLARAWYDDGSLFGPIYDTEGELFKGMLNPKHLAFDPLGYDE